MNNQLYRVEKFGAMADGKTLNTKAVQKAVEECREYAQLLEKRGLCFALQKRNFRWKQVCV